MLRLLRPALLVFLLFWIVVLVIATGRPETGFFEDVVRLALVGGLFAVPVPVRRIGTGRAWDSLRSPCQE